MSILSRDQDTASQDDSARALSKQFASMPLEDAHRSRTVTPRKESSSSKGAHKPSGNLDRANARLSQVTSTSFRESQQAYSDAYTSYSNSSGIGEQLTLSDRCLRRDRDACQPLKALDAQIDMHCTSTINESAYLPAKLRQKYSVCSHLAACGLEPASRLREEAQEERLRRMCRAYMGEAVEESVASPSEHASDDHLSSHPGIVTEPIVQPVLSSSFLTLPTETLTRIAVITGQKDLRNLYTLRQISRQLRTLMDSDYIWCLATGTIIGDDLETAGKIARGTARRKCQYECVACRREDREPSYAPINPALPFGQKLSFCPRCYGSAVDQDNWSKNPRMYAVAYWTYMSSRRAVGPYTPTEVAADAWSRQQDLYRIGCFGVTWQPVYELEPYVSVEFIKLCKEYVFHCGHVEVALSQVQEACTLLRRRHATFEAWARQHLRAIQIAKSVRPASYAIWRERAKIDDMRSHLHLKSLGLGLIKTDNQLLSRQFGSHSRPRQPAVQFLLQEIVCLYWDERKPLPGQLNSVSGWIENYVTSAEGPLTCLLLNCGQTASRGCKCCLCPDHCTPINRDYLRRPATCAVHPDRPHAPQPERIAKQPAVVLNVEAAQSQQAVAQAKMMYETSKQQESMDSRDRTAELAFCKAFRALPAKSAGTLRIFERQEDYTAHGDDAVFVATHVFKTNTVLTYWGGSGSAAVPSCKMSRSVATNLLREALTLRQLRIEIWKDSSSKTSSAQLTLVRQASPGNLGDVEDLLFGNIDLVSSPVIMAIRLSTKDGITTIGMAYADTSLRRIGLTEFVDNDLFSNTESLLVQLGVKEVLMASFEKSKEYEAEKLRQLIDRCSVVITDRKPSDFNIRNIEQDLNRLLRGSPAIATLPESDLRSGMSAVNALIVYLGLLTDESNFGQYDLKSHDLSQYMRLDASAVRALNLVPDPSGYGGGNKNMSIFGLLNRCKTAQGMRLLAQWLKQPLVNLHQIEKRQDLVEIMVEDNFLRESLQEDILRAMPDLQKLAKKLRRGVATLEDVVRIYQVSIKLPDLINHLETVGEGAPAKLALIKESYLSALTENNTALEKYVEMVETTLDLDELANHRYIIKPDFDDELKRIQKKLNAIRKGLDDVYRDVAEDLGVAMDGKVLHFENNPTYGQVFRLTRKESAKLKGKPGYIDLANKTNGLTFTTKKLKALNEDQQDCKESYTRKQSSLVKEVVAIAASYDTILEDLNTTIADLDVIVSLSHVAVNAVGPYVKPKLHEKGQGKLVFREARHPCLEAQDDISFIANDHEFVRGESEFQIITGANMGGKSTYIRQVGCIALMACIGSYVPCTEAELPIFDCILARVGAGDSQLKGVSTFMSEMLETATILKSATKDSLIIIDELGRGTSTFDGFGLAYAISEHIAKEIRAFTLFASHFHEITSLAQEVPSVRNMHVLALVEEKPDSLTGRDVTFLYKVEPGISDQSFGIHVAQLARFPDEVIKLAKRKADDLDDLDKDGSLAVPDATPEEAAAGTALLKEMLSDWAARTAHLADDAATGSSSDDVSMTDSADARLAREQAELRSCFESYRERFDADPWCSKVLMAKT
ncbi:uncharacterized protein L969DRAFT_91533 [Mixia osmundae IAM 14324]|uniref:DNA mismatch repair protein MSH2 n=1 Tax=Mixia osmundae (strain CBS 9802 / IAM 14324 / JCM 22182 / KY 12970) TaxID=764103 RepID=G7DV98_MIXOS|nr:uncharacterized protein L969DRAFT_91533 [Mixia osmundae IAM 14324]KEI42069.1 hypothetical protein L969DRAFT_91533 [Mixia osmundae IAM 14324]GAA94508.1 hypothetical protein E5Q_01160 [Mixia osmundae IAM 14324]